MSDILQMAEGRLGRVIAVRLRPGTDVLPGLEEACKRARINNGVIVSIIGSLSEVRFCDPIEIAGKRAKYGYGDPLQLEGPIELTSASGIICHDDEGVTNLHVHVTLSDKDGNAYGGHLVNGTKVLLTTDVVIAEIEGVVMGRKFDEELEVPIFSPRPAEAENQ
ncbi:MAG: DNA-binding protein [Oscillibacter sp.]|nr:DNA-binding protein [Oscillibacter sp.]